MHTIHINLPRILLVLALLAVTPFAEAQEELYMWQSPDGTVVERCGTLDHINQNGRDLRNVKCGDMYTFVLNGDYMYADVGYNVDDCSYMRLTLDGGRTFRAGDEIEVTAMRNNVADRPATICFLFNVPADGYSRSVRLVDNNVWNNLGQGQDGTLEGGTERGAAHAASGATVAPSVAFVPSTHTFVVPPEADGATYVRLTRYLTGNLLYVARLVVTRPATSGVANATAVPRCHDVARKLTVGGQLVISRNGRLYRADGTPLPSEQYDFVKNNGK